MRRSFTAPTLALILGIHAVPADARVQSVNIDQAPSGAIAEIDVIQTEGPDGRLRYTHVQGDSMTFPAQISGKCKVGYLILDAWLTTSSPQSDTPNGSTEGPASSGGPAPTGPFNTGYHEDVPFTEGNRTFGERVVFFEVPFTNFEKLITEIIDYGNIDVAERAANALEEERIRAQTWTSWQTFSISFQLECKRAVFYTGLKGWTEGEEEDFDLKVNYIGKSSRDDLARKTDPTPYEAVDDLYLRQGVRSVELLALDGLEEGACKLDLSGVIETTAPMTVSYRLVDDKGVRSPLYQVAVDQTLSAYIHHQVDLSDLEPEGPVLTSDGGSPSYGNTYTSHDTDLLQGFYQIEVVSPNEVTSNEASYSMEPCTAPLDETAAYRRENEFSTLR